MSLPQRPGKPSPRREEARTFREPSQRRRRDIDSGTYSDDLTSPRTDTAADIPAIEEQWTRTKSAWTGAAR
ncbi:unnamed protein product [Penicillium nalgiovense]|nr:unnamed protein product [Penicillium nalgiovense]